MPYGGGIRSTAGRGGTSGWYGRQQAYRQGKAFARSRARRKIAFVRGRDRVAGYYGRFRGGFRGPAGELKFFDLDIDDASIAVNGTILEDSCNAISQGTGESQRLGRKCTIKQIGWKFDVRLNQTTASNNTDVVRVILYLDRQCNGATATVTGILESDDFQSFNNLANKSRFSTLMDKTYSLNMAGLAGDGTTTDSGAKILSGSFYKKCNIPLEFDNTTGAITELRSNNIGVLILAKTGALCVFSSKMRLRFVG